MTQQVTVELPKGWVTLTLKDLILISSGKGLTKSKMVEGNIPVYGGNGITGWHNDKNITKPTLIIGRVGFYCGSVYLSPDDAWITDNAFITQFSEEHIDIHYLYWLLTFTDLRQNDSSTAQPVISGQKIYPIIVALPPLQEQKRIVEKLDSLLAQVDTIQQRLNNLPNIIKRFRQSVLAAAVSGKLTEQWREESTDKIDVLKYLVEIDKVRQKEYLSDCVKSKENGERKPRKPGSIDEKMLFNTDWKDQFLSELPEDWAIKAIGYIGENNADSIVDGPFGASINVKRDYIDQGVPVIRINNIKPFSFVSSKLKYITHEKFSELTRHNIVSGDVLFGKVGTIGDASLYPDSMPEGMLSTTGCTRMRVDERVVSKEFTLIYLNAMNPAFNRIASAAVQPFLNMKTVKSFPIPVPCLNEQTEIVRLVDQYFALADTLEKNLANAKKRVDNLTQSILAKAFRGELVPQDPNDEPANKLLERIKTARIEAEKLEKAAKKVAKVNAKKNKGL